MCDADDRDLLERICREMEHTSREEVLALVLRFVAEAAIKPAPHECGCPVTIPVLDCSRRRILTDMHELRLDVRPLYDRRPAEAQIARRRAGISFRDPPDQRAAVH